jgi:O-antigen/teichoic acid export membrane protein
MQILCFSLLLDGVTNINLNLLYVKGRSDLVLRLEIVKKILAFSILFISMFFGLMGMCLGLVVNAYVAFCLNTIYTKRILNYGLWPQLKVMIPYLLCALVVLAEALLLSKYISTSWLSLLLSLIICPVTYWLLARVTGLYACREIRDMVMSKIRNV